MSEAATGRHPAQTANLQESEYVGEETRILSLKSVREVKTIFRVINSLVRIRTQHSGDSSLEDTGVQVFSSSGGSEGHENSVRT